MSTKACLVKSCPALASVRSLPGYCATHHWVASSPEVFEQALKGKLTADMKKFAEDAERGYYPKAFIW